MGCCASSAAAAYDVTASQSRLQQQGRQLQLQPQQKHQQQEQQQPPARELQPSELQQQPRELQPQQELQPHPQLQPQQPQQQQQQHQQQRDRREKRRILIRTSAQASASFLSEVAEEPEGEERRVLFFEIVLIGDCARVVAQRACQVQAKSARAHEGVESSSTHLGTSSAGTSSGGGASSSTGNWQSTFEDDDDIPLSLDDVPPGPAGSGPRPQMVDPFAGTSGGFASHHSGGARDGTGSGSSSTTAYTKLRDSTGRVHFWVVEGPGDELPKFPTSTLDSVAYVVLVPTWYGDRGRLAKLRSRILEIERLYQDLPLEAKPSILTVPLRRRVDSLNDRRLDQTWELWCRALGIEDLSQGSILCIDHPEGLNAFFVQQVAEGLMDSAAPVASADARRTTQDLGEHSISTVSI
mmetsp:Transcript_45841/g.109154  ORF Transcript_45841/g.109154 Transcript_45841/m.109154 type:complete len:410 (-) Transcript_45841:8-1237(-)